MQIVVFTLKDNYYAIESKHVEEISKMTKSTIVPNSNYWVEGLINLRGEIITLVNISKLLQISEENCYNNIVIIHLNEETLGLMVNKVEEVIDVDKTMIEKVYSQKIKKNGVVGLIQLNNNIVNYLDLEQLFMNA